ncbi:MAG: hypothetical protein WCW77_03705, partial [Patescibacteria group bacterium]
ILILLFLGLCNTIWQVIELRENFSSEYETANLEKEAGLKLASEAPLPAFSYGYLWLETLNFYSQRKINMHPGESVESAGIYLIANPKLFQLYRPAKIFRERNEPIFEKGDVGVYRIRPGEATPIFNQ